MNFVLTNNNIIYLRSLQNGIFEILNFNSFGWKRVIVGTILYRHGVLGLVGSDKGVTIKGGYYYSQFGVVEFLLGELDQYNRTCWPMTPIEYDH